MHLDGSSVSPFNLSESQDDSFPGPLRPYLALVSGLNFGDACAQRAEALEALRTQAPNRRGPWARRGGPRSSVRLRQFVS